MRATFGGDPEDLGFERSETRNCPRCGGELFVKRKRVPATFGEPARATTAYRCRPCGPIRSEELGQNPHREE